MKRSFMNSSLALIVIISFILFTSTLSIAEIPRKINYHGMLPPSESYHEEQIVSPDGTLVVDKKPPLPQGKFEMIFSIYDADTDGDLKWLETWDNNTTPVEVINGMFHVSLGTHAPLDLPFDQPYWIETEVFDPETSSWKIIGKRQQLLSTPYAFMAENISPNAVVNIDGYSISSGVISADYIEDRFLRNDEDDMITGILTTAGLNVDENTLNVDSVNNRVGIGVKNPSTPFSLMGNGGRYAVGITQKQVGGSATMELTTADSENRQATRMLLRGASDNANVEFYRGGRGQEQLSMFISGTNGNVGIGTREPTHKLDVAGNIHASAKIFASAYSSNSPLILEAPAGAERIRIEELNGKVGIGTKDRLSKLTVKQPVDNTDFHICGTTTANSATTITGSQNSFFTNLGIGDRISLSSVPFTYATVTDISSDTSLTVDTLLGNGTSQTINVKHGILRLDDAAGNVKLMVNDQGNVGIGTKIPKAKLHVEGDGIKLSSGAKSIQMRANGMWLDLESVGQPLAINYLSGQPVHIGSGNKAANLNVDGNVDIGFNTKGAKLTVNGDEISLSKAIDQWPYIKTIRMRTTGAWLDLESIGKPFALNYTSGQPVCLGSVGTPADLYIYGKVGIGTMDPKYELDVTGKINATIINATGIYKNGKALKESRWEEGTGGILYYNAGNVGIGTVDPKYELDITGKINATDIYKNGKVLKESKWEEGTSGILYYNAGNVGIGTTSPADKLHINGGTTIDGAMTINGIANINNTVNIKGATTIKGDTTVDGTTNTKVLKITGGADIAEPFEVKEAKKVIPGMILVIDSENQGKLKISDKEYDHCVAGIISGAGNIKSGLTLAQEGLIEGEHNVALTGRVYALATAGNGPIKPGDLLTTSNVPGYAMKATDRERFAGAVIGKAMSNLKKGEGLVLVLVNLQ